MRPATFSPVSIFSMMALNSRTTGFVYYFVLFLCTNIAKSLDTCEDALYIIRSTHPTALVLDGTDSFNVKVQPFTGFTTQLWSVQPSDTPSLFFVVNAYHKKALHFYQRPAEDFLSLVMNDKRSTGEQQWYFTGKGRIANAANQKNIDIINANFTAGNRVIVWMENGCPCQEFVFVKKV